MYSYPALQSRLADNPFARGDWMDMTGPVLRLGTLGREHFMALLRKVQAVYQHGQPDHAQLPPEAIPAFMQHCEQRIGEATFRTPRTTITAFIGLLAVLEQNPGAAWLTLLQQAQVDMAKAPEAINFGDELSDLII